MVMKVGMIGLSEGNGHPFSFSAIINGYDAEAFSQAGWPVIFDYLEKQDKAEIGLEGVEVSHVWTQDPAISDHLSRSCFIPNIARNPEDMIGDVDAVIIARDDYENHLTMALPFLQAGLNVFVDKPLAIDPEELAVLVPYLKKGQLLSGSGFRFAQELDELRSQPDTLGPLVLVEATVVNGLEKYGIHMLEALAGLGFGVPKSVSRISDHRDMFLFTMPDDTPLLLSCLGSVGKTFHLGFYGKYGNLQIDLHNNFAAFRRLLMNFFETVTSGAFSYAPEETLALMKAIKTARDCRPYETAPISW
ncbi:MAG: hypothetical protein D6763_04295 [Alphaproteobacteria bacterium]|nr:MAG: hypothetical protein D6763_04295 [Alphaproteobacteria bacterium]